ncbi:ATP-binding protein [Marinomonas algicola]|uniref:ATP-binding protein n=1 Tax=Marinomonas algicola TaxID=2773454 RepID=UPI00174EB156|nr:ATP-binding protein [Marinomonas algicola]
MMNNDMKSQENQSSRLVEEKFRLMGFRILIVLSTVITAVIIFLSPNNFFIAILFPLVWFVLSGVSLLKKNYSAVLAKVWVLFTVPLVPFLVLSNGMAPAALVSLGAILASLLVHGLWRIIAALLIALSTFLVPFSGLEYDPAILVRLFVANMTITVGLLIILHYLEKTLIDSLEKTVALEVALEGQRKANDAQSLFLATMSHEIRTPMNGILGLLDAVLTGELSKTQRSHLVKVQQSSHLLQTILNGILDYSKLNAGKLVFETTPFNMRQLLVDAASFFQLQAGNKEISLTTDIDPLLGDAHLGDSVRITQILNNLLSNAIKFTHKGSVVLSLEVVNTTSEFQTLRFSVSDSGIGISSVEKERIFSPFIQANQSTSRMFGGTGLGLQIVKSLVEQMNGEVWVESEKNKGSQFYVILTLPLTTHERIKRPDSTECNSQKFLGKVLVVEDNPVNRLVAQELLRPVVDDVLFALDGREAVKFVDENRFDLIFMDLNMPNMDGFEATQKIREKHKDVPIVALTAAVLADEVEKALLSGMNGHLAKPIDINKLLNVINRYLTPHDSQ